MGIMKGADAIVQKSGNVKGMPVAALNFDFGGMVAGQYDSARFNSSICLC